MIEELGIADVSQILFFNNEEKICFKNQTAFLLKRLFSPSGLIRVPVTA